jgi:thioesterase domain-containing protein/acyl carrier protein
MGDGHLPIEPDDVVLQISAREFDAFTWEIWGALLNGACLQLLPPGWSVSQLGRAIEDGGVTAAFFTARLFDLLVESAPQTLAGMRLVSFGGEAASPRHCAMARTLFPGVLLINGYGPTENTTFTCSYRLGEGVETEEMEPIGTARNGDITLLLDPETLDPIEGEGTGELYVGGPGLALGYTDPALTAERFVTHPRLGLKLFKTNDWVQRLPGGQLHFLGRIDRQVKVRGFRVDLSQVERALCLHPDVLSAHVVFETVLDRQEIVAFLRTRSGHPIGRPELQHFLDGRLDLHAFPNWFEHVDALPLKGNGKADVAELVRRFRARVAPAPVDDPLEALWRRMLFPAEITESTNFFAEGGDSFAALNLILETERIFGITLPADYLARNPVLADFRAKLESAGGPSLVNPPEAVDGAPLLVLLPWLNGRPDTFGNLLPSLAFDGQVVTIDMTQIECDMTIGGIGDISRILADAIAPLDPGPISVAGPSLAGAIALDLGAELTARGFAVDTIIILDGYAPWLISLDKALETVSRTFSRLQGKREAPYRPRSDALPAPAGAPRPLIDRLLDRLGSFSRFEPRIPQARSIHLVMAAETHANRFIRRVPLHGWKRAVPQISGSFAAGDHLTMLNAVHGPALARLISQILSKDDQRTSTIARNLTQVQRTRSAR